MIERQPLESFEPENEGGCVPPQWDDSRAGLQKSYGSVPKVGVKHLECSSPLWIQSFPGNHDMALTMLHGGAEASYEQPLAHADGWQHHL